MDELATAASIGFGTIASTTSSGGERTAERG